MKNLRFPTEKDERIDDDGEFIHLPLPVWRVRDYVVVRMPLIMFCEFTNKQFGIKSMCFNNLAPDADPIGVRFRKWTTRLINENRFHTHTRELVVIL